MNLHSNYAAINSIESVLISEQQPTKFFSDTKTLVQSKHLEDNVYFFFNPPSSQCFEKLSKISPNDPKSVGRDSNANLRALILTSLQIAFSSKQEGYKNFIIDKIGNQNSQNMKVQDIKNHNHQCISTGNMLKVVSGFLKTLSNKKLKNPEVFDMKKQLQALPIILNYLVIVCRMILNKFHIQNAQDYCKPVKDSQTFHILSDYFDINFIQKDSFYFFEEETLFIFNFHNEYIIGRYSSIQNMPSNNKDNPIIKKSQQRNKMYNNSQIMECCSMEQGSCLVSSRHADESTPCFNDDQCTFKSNDIKQTENYHQKQQTSSLNLKSNQPLAKQYESKSSGFQVNVYSQQKDKFFNNKYRNDKKIEKLFDSNKQTMLKQTIYEKTEDIDRVQGKVFPFNGIENPHNIQSFKKNSSDRNYFQTTLLDLKKYNFDQSEEQKLILQQKGLQEKQNFTKKINKDCIHDKIFQWENADNRLRRVQTICYKTCSTCNRRFYRNQLQSNVLQVTIFVNPKSKQSKNNQSQPNSQLFFRNTPQFLNKKFQKKSNEVKNEDLILKDYSMTMQSPQIQKQKINPERGFQFNWLNKKIKVEGASQLEKRQSPRENPLKSPKQTDIKNIFNSKNEGQSSKKVLSTKNLLFHHKQNAKSPDIKAIIPVKVNQYRKFSGDTYEIGPKPKSFFTLKSAKDLQKITSKQRNIFSKEKSNNEKKVNGLCKNLQNTHNSTINGNFLISKNDQKSRSDGMNRRNDLINLTDLNKSTDKRMPRFIKKEFTSTDLNLIMNN